MNLDHLKTYKIKILDNKVCLRDLITQTKNTQISQQIIDFVKGKKNI
jgi:hypothetical protein